MEDKEIKDLGIVPLGARVLVEKYKENDSSLDIDVNGQVVNDENVKKTDSGLFIAQDLQDKSNLEFNRNSGKIVALGTGLSLEAVPHLKIGTVISFSNPHEIQYKGVDYYLIHENNINLIHVG